jgi:hypothetical protein
MKSMSDNENNTPTYYQMNRERFAEKKKLWAQNNRDKIKESNKRWREKNREYLKQKQKEYNKTGYYKNKLIQKFNVMKDEIVIGNDSEELLNEFKDLLSEMLHREIIDEDEYNKLISLI